MSALGPSGPRAGSDILDIPPEVAAFEAAAIALLRTVMLDGAAKRADGRKRDPWQTDPGHGSSLYRHLFKWRRGERIDADSGSHPLVHVAARALMQAYQELNGFGPIPGAPRTSHFSQTRH